MAKCASCNSTIVMGGETHGGLRFCSKDCANRGFIIPIAQGIPIEAVSAQAAAVFVGACPKCKGPGPVDLHYSHFVYSIVVMTSWRTNSHICCGRCGKKEMVKDGLASLLIGWWGFPWGLIMTPIYVGKNIHEFAKKRDSGTPSPELCQHVRMWMASNIVAQRTAAGAAPRA